MKQSVIKRVLVTGGSRGIGRACVEYFSSLGCQVAFVYQKNEAAAAQTAEKFGAIPIKCDVSFGDDVVKAVARAAEAMGGIDILVNNAAVSHIGLFDEMTDEQINNVMSVNLTGAMLVSRETVKYMLPQKCGRIINIGSMWGKTGAACEVHYSASKAGLRGFTVSLAKELGPSGITVNCIEPGVIATEMNASLDGDTLRELCDETPVCRIGTVDDVVNAVEFFASEKSSFITGQILGVDGGFAV